MVMRFCVETLRSEIHSIINLETTSDNVSYVRFELLFSLGIRNSRFLGTLLLARLLIRRVT